MADSTETRKERRAAARDEQRAAEAARARRRQRWWIAGGALGLVAAVVVVIVLATSGGGDGGSKGTSARGGQNVLPGQVEANARFAGIPQSGISVGDPRAPLTLVEFADLQCPFCRDYTTNVMPAIVDQYVRTGKVRMEFRNVAFIGTDSLTAARMAAAAGMQDELWPFVDIFYSNQGEENSGYVTDAFLRQIGRAVRGLDVEKALHDRNLPAVDRLLNTANVEWQSNGFTGTPSFLLGPTGGRLESLLGDREAPTVALVSQRIDEALARLR